MQLISNSTLEDQKKKIILITGMSGTGKSTVLEALSLRGYKVVDTDYDGWVEYGTDSRWGSGWLWNEKRIQSLLNEHTKDTLFISGTVSNQGKFYSYFDVVILLSAPLDVMHQRIKSRTSHNYGKTKEQWEEIVNNLETVEPLLRKSADAIIDTRKPLEEVLCEIEKCVIN